VTVLNLDVGTAVHEEILGLELRVVLAGDSCETPVVRDDDLLATGELVRSATEGLAGLGLEVHAGTERVDDLSDVDAGGNAEGLTESVTHTAGQTISASARKHFVLSQDHEGVSADAKVETFLGGADNHELVDDNTAGLEALRSELLFLHAHKVDAERELISAGGPLATIEDSDLGFRHTTKVSGLDVRLVLTVAVAASWTATHGA